MGSFVAYGSFLIETFLVCATIVLFLAILAFVFCSVVSIGAKTYRKVCDIVDKVQDDDNGDDD